VSANGSPAIALAGKAFDQRIYRLCLFEPGAVVPRVQLLSAPSDEEAVALAVDIDPVAEREVWDRHRLVAMLPATTEPVLELTVRA
jgi:hypothetical protein